MAQSFMKNLINNLTGDKLAFRGFVISFLLTLFTLLYIAINYTNLPPLIPIFNQLPWGDNRLTPTIGIFIPIALFIIIFIFNVLFTSIVYSKNPLIARFVAAVTLILAMMNLLFIARTIIKII
jgi:hypothetical protein